MKPLYRFLMTSSNECRTLSNIDHAAQFKWQDRNPQLTLEGWQMPTLSYREPLKKQPKIRQNSACLIPFPMFSFEASLANALFPNKHNAMTLLPIKVESEDWYALGGDLRCSEQEFNLDQSLMPIKPKSVTDTIMLEQRLVMNRMRSHLEHNLFVLPYQNFSILFSEPLRKRIEDNNVFGVQIQEIGYILSDDVTITSLPAFKGLDTPFAETTVRKHASSTQPETVNIKSQLTAYANRELSEEELDSWLWTWLCDHVDDKSPSYVQLPDVIRQVYASRLITWDYDNGGFTQAAQHSADIFKDAVHGLHAMGCSEAAHLVEKARHLIGDQSSKSALSQLDSEQSRHELPTPDWNDVKCRMDYALKYREIFETLQSKS